MIGFQEEDYDAYGFCGFKGGFSQRVEDFNLMKGLSVRPVWEAFIPETRIELNKSELSLIENESFTSTATITPPNATRRNLIVWESSDNNVAEVYEGQVRAKSVGVCTITARCGSVSTSCSVTVSTYQFEKGQYVDLGLSVKWATLNIGATNDNLYGDYFAWGETAPKSIYSAESYKHWILIQSNVYITKYCTNSVYGYNGFVDNKATLDLEDDAAHANWGGKWRMPTREEIDELIDNCSWDWTTIHLVDGYKVQSKKPGYTDKWIFLPAAGFRDDNNLNYASSNGYYWSSSLNPDLGILSYLLEFSFGSWDCGYFVSNCGLSVRAVCP